MLLEILKDMCSIVDGPCLVCAVLVDMVNDGAWVVLFVGKLCF